MPSTLGHSGVIGSLVEFEESTAFERWALAGIVPLPTARPHIAIKDIEQNAVRVMLRTAMVHVYAGGVTEVHVDLRPLAVGAAWKVLDLLVELALSQAGLGTRKSMTITAKAGQATQANGKCAPLTLDPPLWRSLSATYAATTEIRHSLVHRQAAVDEATGELTGSDRNGGSLPPVSGKQQEAFCRLVQRAAESTLRQGISPRERSDLAWNLDALAHLHGQPLIGGQQMEPASLAITPTRMRGGNVLVDAPALLDELRKNFPGSAAYDATYELPDGRHLLVELEQAPATEVAVDLHALQSWAVLWEGPSN